MNAPRASVLAGMFRAVSMPILLAVFAVAFLCASVVELASLMRTGSQQDAAIEAQRVHIAADTALLTNAHRGVGASGEVEVAGVRLRLSQLVGEDGCEQHVIKPVEPALAGVFTARRLEGGSARSFTNRRVATDVATLQVLGGGLLEDPAGWPRPLARTLATAQRADVAAGIVRDRGVALQLLASGTDRSDFVWRECQPDERRSFRGQVLVVPGNLWIPPGERPFEVTLSHDLVVLVQGNLYVLRSLQTFGPGRLLLATVAADDAVVFADVDGNGSWSGGDQLRVGQAFAGPIEGAGSVYVGLAHARAAEAIRIDCGLLVAGELHLAAPLQAQGPLMLRHGLTRLRACRDLPIDELLPAGRDGWTYSVGRDWVPGFAVRGAARPGRLEFRAR